MPTAAQIWQLAQGLDSIPAVALVALISGLTWLGVAWIKQRPDYQRSLNEERDRQTAQYEAETARETRMRELDIKARELEIFGRLAEVGAKWGEAVPSEALLPLPLKSSARIATAPEAQGEKAA